MAVPSKLHRHLRTSRQVMLVAVVLGAGFAMRSWQAGQASSGASAWWPWGSTTVTLYFTDGRFMVPVSRRMPTNDELPRATLEALLAGPRVGTGLTNLVPPDVAIRSLEIVDGTARVDLSAAFLDAPVDRQAAETAIVETMTTVPGVMSVALHVEGTPLTDAAGRVPLLYFPSDNGLVAVPTSAADPRAAVAAFMSGPPDPALTGLPADVRLLDYRHDEADALLSLDFAYTPSVHALAMDRPERMRTLLLGLIAGLTEFPGVRTVRLDFEGQSRLGLGQCSDLLRAPQPRPALLNDERLLGRLAGFR